MRAYQQTNHPLDFVAALRTDEQGLFCDWEAANNPNFKILFFGSEFPIPLRPDGGDDGDRRQDGAAPHRRSLQDEAGGEGLCNQSLPMEMSVSTLVDSDTLKAMFAGN